jgi:putative endonuclease
MRSYQVYIAASGRNGTLYVGVTNDLARRAQEHRDGTLPGFTKDYGVNRLVYVESYTHIADAIRREKQLKRWRRAWKIALIEEHNPFWKDLLLDEPQ